MKTGIYHTTVFTTPNGILLKKQSVPSSVETYCIGYIVETGKRDKSYDGYYYNSELTPIVIN